MKLPARCRRPQPLHAPRGSFGPCSYSQPLPAPLLPAAAPPPRSLLCPPPCPASQAYADPSTGKLSAIDCSMRMDSTSLRVVVKGSGPLGKFAANISGVTVHGAARGHTGWGGGGAGRGWG